MEFRLYRHPILCVLMPYTEDELLPLSALQHLAFCERQCALIHIEQAWSENRLTAEGRNLHKRVDDGGVEARPGIRTAFGLKLRSLRLGLSGKADAVEFVETQSGGVSLPGVNGRWIPYPVEYKRGKPKPDRSDEIQVCAQAMCLEEMLGVEVPRGAIFYGIPRRRMEVEFDAVLRGEVEGAADRLHRLLVSGRTPPAVIEKKCRNCSLLDGCLPGVAGDKTSVGEYFRSVFS
ncbi:MAG: CRISPR-associated protein Cas4 [Planctomycetota bacterium]